MFTVKRAPVAIAVLVLATALVACADDDDIASPPRAPAFAAGGQQAAGPSSLDLIEQDYSGGLLDKNSANRYRQYAVFAPDKLPAKYRSNVVGKDATYSMVQMAKEFDDLSAAAQTEILDLQAKGFGELKHTLETPHFVLHYATQGNSAVPAVDADGNGISDFID
ncbi:MAG TPA: hypothetical protein VFO52_00050, partial [Longimicrobiales bacterium]|nr:hypothetical protein [Longimicrobiales bacterium]